MNILKESLTHSELVNSLNQLQKAKKKIKRDIASQKKKLRELKVLPSVAKFIITAISFWVEGKGLAAGKFFWGYKRARRYANAVEASLPEHPAANQLIFSLWTERVFGPLTAVYLKVESREKPW